MTEMRGSSVLCLLWCSDGRYLPHSNQEPVCLYHLHCPGDLISSSQQEASVGGQFQAVNILEEETVVDILSTFPPGSWEGFATGLQRSSLSVIHIHSGRLPLPSLLSSSVSCHPSPQLHLLFIWAALTRACLVSSGGGASGGWKLGLRWGLLVLWEPFGLMETFHGVLCWFCYTFPASVSSLCSGGNENCHRCHEPSTWPTLSYRMLLHLFSQSKQWGIGDSVNRIAVVTSMEGGGQRRLQNQKGS